MNSSDLIIKILCSNLWWFVAVCFPALQTKLTSLYRHKIHLDKTKRNILAFTVIFWHIKRPLKYSNLFPDVSIYSSIIHIDLWILSNAYKTVLALKFQYIHVYPGDVPVQGISSSSWNVWRASKDSLNFYNVCRTEREGKKSLRSWKRLDNNCERPRRALNTSVWVFLKIPAIERGSVGASMCAITLKISLLIFQHPCFSLI